MNIYAEILRNQENHMINDYVNTNIYNNHTIFNNRNVSPDEIRTAIQNHSSVSLSHLIADGADLNTRFDWTSLDGTNQWGTALHYAVSIATKPVTHEEVYQHDLLVTRILDAGIDESSDNGSDTPLKFAIQCSNVEAVDRLLNKGADPNYWLDGDSPLVTAVKVGDIRIVDLLIDAGADVNGEDFTSSPLCAAIDLNDALSITALLAAGANREGRTELDGFEFTWEVKRVTIQM